MRVTRVASAVTGAALLLTASACSEEAVFSSNVSDETDPAAAAISVPPDASVLRTSALGPDLLNYGAPKGSPMSYVDQAVLTDEGHLPDGMTVTEAQSLQVLEKVRDLLAARKMKFHEVATVRAYLSPDGDRDTDFEGWERAYRRYFANIDRETGGSMLTEPSAAVRELYPGSDNRTRPTLVTVGVAEQPVKGWLVQVEIEVAHGED